jgi:hypothetical protein
MRAMQAARALRRTHWKHFEQNKPNFGKHAYHTSNRGYLSGTIELLNRYSTFGASDPLVAVKRH